MFLRVTLIIYSDKAKVASCRPEMKTKANNTKYNASYEL